MRAALGIMIAVLLLVNCSGPEQRDAPAINPDDFTTNVDNPYFALDVGKKLVYESETGEGMERVEILIPGWTREVMGVDTLVYWDRVYLDDILVEDTRDYVAQHKASGDVWYFGEHVDNYENGAFIDHDGAWLAGVDGAQPGTWVLGNPRVGDSFLNEYYVGEAEDESEVVAIGQAAETPYGAFADCLQHLDGSRLFPEKAYKYYCRDAGAMVLEVELDEKLDVEQTVLLVSVEPEGALGVELSKRYADEGVVDHP